MRITARLRKIKKMIGSEVVYTYQDEFFTPVKPTSTIVGVHVFSLYDIRLIVEMEGIVSPMNTTKKYTVTRMESVPLIKILLGKMVFPVYQCLNQKSKTVFIAKNDIDSSLIKDSDYSYLEKMEKTLNNLKKNINVKKNFICNDPISAIHKIFGVSKEEAKMLKEIGLTPFGWRTNLDETFIFDPRLFDPDIVHEISDAVEQTEKLSIYLGLLKLSKQKFKKIK